MRTRILPNGEKETMKSCFTIDDAVKAGLADRDVWKKYPRRMLKHRCLSYGLKDMFPDLLAGLYDPEEMESIVQPTTNERNVTPVEEPVAEKVVTPVEPDDRQKLSDILVTYEKELNGQPYELSCHALADNDPAKISEMLGRCVVYLGKKGIKVA